MITYNLLFDSQHGFRENYSNETATIELTDHLLTQIDNKHLPIGIFLDLSKAFDCLSHDLLIAKLEAYGFDKSALKLIYDYLRGRKQRTKVGGSYSRDLFNGVPQGSILGPLLFTILIFAEYNYHGFIYETRDVHIAHTCRSLRSAVTQTFFDDSF